MLSLESLLLGKFTSWKVYFLESLLLGQKSLSPRLFLDLSLPSLHVILKQNLVGNFDASFGHAALHRYTLIFYPIPEMVALRWHSLWTLNPIIFHFFLGSPIWKPRDGGGPTSDHQPKQENGKRHPPAAPAEPPGVPARPGSRLANNVGFEGDNLQTACKRTTPTTHK